MLGRAERMGCKEASLPMNLVRKLYKREDLYVEKGYDAEKIKEMRNDELFFGSVQGALRSAMYNTFIQTCKQVGVSFRQYFKALLKAVKSGRTDYENLLPMTICLD